MNHKILRTCLATVLVFVLLYGTLEGLTRTSLAKNRLLPPSYGGEYLNIDQQFAYLEDHPEINCIFLGSSMTRTMIDPHRVEEAYHTATANEMHCFNLAINGMPLPVIAMLSEFVQKHYEPQWLIIEISHQAFFDRNPNEFYASVLENEWIAYHRGDFNTNGWLLDHSAVYRYLQTYKNWASPQYTTAIATFHDEQKRFNTQNFYGATIPKDNVWLAISPQNSTWERNFIASHRRWKKNKVDWSTLERALTQYSATRIILLEAPVHDSYMGLYPNGREDWQVFISTIQRYTRKAKVPFWITNDKLTIADEFWHSRNHVLWGAALQLSDWVGTQMGLAEQQAFPLGDVPDPTLPLRPIEDFFTPPFALPENLVEAYAQFAPNLPADATIVHLSDENPRYFAYNIGAYIQVNGREPDDFQLLWLLEHAQTSPVEQADYILVSEFWLNHQPQAQQDELHNPERYVRVARYKHPALPMAYLIYRVLESESP